ncbi:hypothetical protein IE53DRAFT_778 [Violaceomyces palustris]|uniref:Uncharacterized protein n=1 Tax=Violaceomyces palustris TaxID=1673888 RepID=A0ACD0P925_9BASI|nr:hypothetical protein IE53DRAFT_778 [Violaceomyces palustris]
MRVKGPWIIPLPWSLFPSFPISLPSSSSTASPAPYVLSPFLLFVDQEERREQGREEKRGSSACVHTYIQVDKLAILKFQVSSYLHSSLFFFDEL